ncbi:MAG TPA: hypothetical protein PLR50_08165, partial [Candidatus Rifleibacterium sp.]|nr:hypothetical protein [Candidatus Rifleibacterium sp.]
GDSGTIKVDLDKKFDPNELQRLVDGKIKADLEIKLSDDLSKKKDDDAAELDANSILAALVKILLNALKGIAAAEGTPVAVSS